MIEISRKTEEMDRVDYMYRMGLMAAGLNLLGRYFIPFCSDVLLR